MTADVFAANVVDDVTLGFRFPFVTMDIWYLVAVWFTNQNCEAAMVAKRTSEATWFDLASFMHCHARYSVKALLFLPELSATPAEIIPF